MLRSWVCLCSVRSGVFQLDAVLNQIIVFQGSRGNFLVASKSKGPARFLAEKNRNGPRRRNRKTVSPFRIGSLQFRVMTFRNFSLSFI